MGLENNRHLKAIGIMDDDGIERRVEAIKKISGRLRRRTRSSELLSMANQAVQALTDNELNADELSAILKIMEKSAPSFVYDDSQANQVSLLFVLGFADAIDVGPNASAANMSLLATAANCALAYLSPLGDPAREDLRRDLLGLTRRKAEAEASREREPIPDLSPENTTEVIARLGRNAGKDREEIDLLWWVLNDWSQLGDFQLSTSPPELAAVYSAIETSALMYGPGQRAHRDIATRHVRGAEERCEPGEFALATQPARRAARLALSSGLSSIEANQAVFPALAIVTMDEADEAVPAGATAGHGYTVSDWCRRLVEELSLLRRLGHVARLIRAETQ
jgi:hypothetical protein